MLSLVPRVRASELVDLARTQAERWPKQHAAVFYAIAPCDKLKSARAGNIVRQLHVHVWRALNRRRHDRFRRGAGTCTLRAMHWPQD